MISNSQNFNPPFQGHYYPLFSPTEVSPTEGIISEESSSLELNKSPSENSLDSFDNFQLEFKENKSKLLTETLIAKGIIKSSKKGAKAQTPAQKKSYRAKIYRDKKKAEFEDLKSLVALLREENSKIPELNQQMSDLTQQNVRLNERLQNALIRTNNQQTLLINQDAQLRARTSLIHNLYDQIDELQQQNYFLNEAQKNQNLTSLSENISTNNDQVSQPMSDFFDEWDKVTVENFLGNSN